MEASSSTSASGEGALAAIGISVFDMSAADDSFAIEVLSSTLLERCSRWKALDAAELGLRCLDRNMELRLSMPVLTMRKS